MLRSHISGSVGQKVAVGTFTNREGFRLSYTVAGVGQVCVFPAPGWGPSVDYAFRTLKPLGAGLTMVYLDTRGTGRSHEPPSEEDYRWGQFAADLDELRENLGQDTVWVMGHSWASLHALSYALAYSDHVEALILVGGLVATDDSFARDRAACLAERLGAPRAVEALALLDAQLDSEEAFHRNMDETLPLYFHSADGVQRFTEHAAATRFSPHAWRGRAACQLPVDLSGRLSELHMPTLIIVGAADAVCPPTQSGRLHQGIAGSELLVIEDAGHFPWIEKPEAFYRGVETFVSGLSGAKRPGST